MEIPHEQGPIPMVVGDLHFREFDLEAEDFLHVIAMQQGIDVEVRLKSEQGETVWRVDSPNGSEGPEELLEIVPTAGRYRIEVAPTKDEAPAGQYTFEEQARRPATAEDRELVEADHRYHNGRKLAKKRELGLAIESFQRALKTWQDLGLPRREADTLNALGLAHKRLGELRLALAFGDRSAELYRQLEDRRRLAVALHQNGVLRMRLPQGAQAIEDLKAALELYASLETRREEALCGARLGVAYRRQGEVRLALQHLELALEQIGTAASRARASILIDLSRVLLMLNRPQDALGHSAEALAIYRKEEYARGIAFALEAQANAASQLGRIAEAIGFQEEALALFVESGDHRRHQIALSNLGRLRRLAGNQDGARGALEEAIALSRSSDNSPGEAVARMELGHLLAERGAAEEGEEHLERAIELFRKAGDQPGLASARARSAEVLRALGRPEKAMEQMSSVLDVIEKLRAGAARQDFRLDYYAYRQEYYEIAIEILMDLHGQHEGAGHHIGALRVHERRLARELRDALDRQPPSKTAADLELRRQEEELERRLSELAGQLPSGGPEVGQEIDGVLAQLHKVWGRIGVAAEPRPQKSAPLTGLDEVRGRLLDAESLLLVYALGEERSFLWAVPAQGEVEVHELPPRRDLERRARGFASSLVGPDSDSTSLGRRLSDELLAPVAAKMRDRRLILVADGALHSVPFAALPEPETKGDPLILKHEIVVLPSISTLALLRHGEAERPEPTKAIAAFADPVFTADDPRVVGARDATPADPAGETERGELLRLGRQLGSDPFARLPYTRSEAETILAALPEDQRFLATDFAANRETFLALPAGEYQVLHLATHAMVSPEHPELSGLVLSLVDERGQLRKGYLRSYEIARLDLPAELVNLSACETGVGKQVPGEGSLALARAFLAAGATRVVASLWKVSDRHTASLMTRFYDGYLKRELAPAAALREAQLSLLQDPDTAEPFAWAAFVMHGDWRSPRK